MLAGLALSVATVAGAQTGTGGPAPQGGPVAKKAAAPPPALRSLSGAAGARGWCVARSGGQGPSAGGVCRSAVPALQGGANDDGSTREGLPECAHRLPELSAGRDSSVCLQGCGVWVLHSEAEERRLLSLCGRGV